MERIVTSSSFAKSDRLCKFLLHISELSLQGREQEINEVNIGNRLFGRSNYDPSVDGIVRSHASRMRQRLELYFDGEGSGETLRLVIPKGAYIPVFEPRLLPPDLHLPAIEAPADVAETATSLPLSSNASPRSVPWALWGLGTMLLLACLTILALVMMLQSRANALPASLDGHPLWGALFGTGHHTLVVCSDTSLTVLQDLTGREVNLSDYLNSSYRMELPPAAGASPETLRNLTSRRYTAIADVGILTRFYKLPGIQADRVEFRYAREVLPDELKRGSTVLIGSKYSDPWVGLFEPHMNFVFRDDPKQRTSTVINRAPKPGEAAEYSYTGTDEAHKVYGIVALRPNLTGSGKVLLLEGTTMAGTEAAADFVFEDNHLLPFLAEITKRTGHLPYFELLLQSSNMNGTASQARIIGYRVSND